MPANLPRRLGNLTLLGVAWALSACGGLPEAGERTRSTAMSGNGRTRLAAAVRQDLAAHPGQSGLHALAAGRDAFAARVALADAAQRSLDVQYYIWHRDLAGKALLERVLQAADRGVRVRLLLDDLGTMPSDATLLAIDSHRNIEVRMFNPVALRSLRFAGMITDFSRINRRMHNKSFIADGQVAIVGGRNIGDEYFAADNTANFADLDVAMIGPVVNEVSAGFDLYWNHRAAIPIANLSRRKTTPEEVAAQRAALGEHHDGAALSDFGESMRGSGFARQLRNRTIPYFWGDASMVSDHPDKILSSAAKTGTRLAPSLRAAVDATNRELFLVSPYFVPGKQGVALLAAVRQRGVRVVVITNSLASTDGIPVHAGYQRYRRPLLEAGVELYEMKPTAGAPLAPGPRNLGGSSIASLHAKTFTFDRRKGFIGSYNLDPRSNKLNTEMGVLFDIPEMAARLPVALERRMDRDAYRLALVDGQLVWLTLEGDKQVRYDSEPGATPWKRAKVRLLSWLPIESLL